MKFSIFLDAKGKSYVEICRSNLDEISPIQCITIGIIYINVFRLCVYSHCIIRAPKNNIAAISCPERGKKEATRRESIFNFNFANVIISSDRNAGGRPLLGSVVRARRTHSAPSINETHGHESGNL